MQPKEAGALRAGLAKVGTTPEEPIWLHGYEARGLVAEIGFYSAEAQDVVIDTLCRLAKEAGRRLPAQP